MRLRDHQIDTDLQYNTQQTTFMGSPRICMAIIWVLHYHYTVIAYCPNEVIWLTKKKTKQRHKVHQMNEKKRGMCVSFLSHSCWLYGFTRLGLLRLSNLNRSIYSVDWQTDRPTLSDNFSAEFDWRLPQIKHFPCIKSCIHIECAMINSFSYMMQTTGKCTTLPNRIWQSCTQNSVR